MSTKFISRSCLRRTADSFKSTNNGPAVVRTKQRESKNPSALFTQDESRQPSKNCCSKNNRDFHTSLLF